MSELEVDAQVGPRRPGCRGSRAACRLDGIRSPSLRGSRGRECNRQQALPLEVHPQDYKSIDTTLLGALEAEDV